MPKSLIYDVAQRAGVSIKTVSRVVNNEPNVRENTREKVLAVIKELNYRPNASARKLASQKSYLIALLYDDPSLYDNPSSNYVLNLQQGALRICKSETYDLLIHPCDYRDKNLNQEVSSLIHNSRVDGLLLAPPLSDQKSLIETIAATDTPFALISPGNKTLTPLSVFTNDREVSAEMTEYLAFLGHKKIAFIKGDPEHKALQERYSGFKDGMRNSGLKIEKNFVKNGDNSFGCGELFAKQLLSLKNPPTAIFCCNDDMANGVLRTAYKMGIKVPDSLSVAGFDDIPLAEQTNPSLTTIRQPVRSMTEHALEILMDKVKNRESKISPDDLLIKAKLVIRESTGKAPS
ncbi:LacI family transcriptional regulator [Aliikangiella marina]|uniref:LacI family transcriptional regulator n=1 Tax=Aliikangiella marina TaxID=1712262 RepID=A0A545T2V5_9GAMM|nr:LacI family DNA-binding transcriptional regulator [Aliikangiella marina]TQV71546.1 LacI family transcriptional regulator [Aliikangiella marina]